MKLHDYWNENVSNEFFSFFCHYYRTRVAADRLSRMPLFHQFYPKIDSNAHFNSVFSNIGWFNRKAVNTVRFSIIRISITFMHLRSKLTSEICQKVGSLGEKTEQNSLKVSTLQPFSPQNHCIYWKTKNPNQFYIIKISVLTNFMCLR